MKTSSFSQDVDFQQERVQTKLILESSFSKEIRIVLSKGQLMKEHKTPYPIVVHLLEGVVDFGVANATHRLTRGAILTLEGNVPHDLLAVEDSVVRLSLSKLDKAERVQDVARSSSE